jgi:hypothetical protein
MKIALLTRAKPWYDEYVFWCRIFEKEKSNADRLVWFRDRESRGIDYRRHGLRGNVERSRCTRPHGPEQRIGRHRIHRRLLMQDERLVNVQLTPEAFKTIVRIIHKELTDLEDRDEDASKVDDAFYQLVMHQRLRFDL